MKIRWKIKGRKKVGKCLPYVILGIVSFFCCYFMAGRIGIFGAQTDWFSQHSVFPAYFRQQFYETGQLVTEFAPNIGGGQNIYYFAYYGLLSPIVLASYLFPFISMENWLMGASIVSLTASVLIFYRWMKKRGFSEIVSFFTALLFLLAGPMIYHSCKQIMFVNYMPFLCLALHGVDRYFEKQKKGLFIVSVFLMIMTSFFFSVGGIVMLVLYGIHRYTQRKEDQGIQVTLKDFFKDGLLFLLPILAAVLMSGVLLLPTALTLGGRNSETEMAYTFSSLFIPDIDPDLFFYNTYGLGLSSLSLTALLTSILYGFSFTGNTRKKVQERVLSWGLGLLFLLPLFCCLLNGGLYVRPKAMIPFLPLMCYLIGWYVRKLEKREICFWAGLLPYLATLAIIFIKREALGKDLEIKISLFNKIQNVESWHLFVLEALLLLGCYLAYTKWRKPLLLLVPSVCCLFLFDSSIYQKTGELLERGFYEKMTAEEIGEKIAETVDGEKGFYRMEQIGTNTENAVNLNRIWTAGQYISSIYSSAYNTEYMDFRMKTFQLDEPFRNFLMRPISKNPIFQKLMGVKYVLSDKSDSNYVITENSWAAPVLYATNRVIGEEDYRKLEFPYNQTALAEYAVVERSGLDMGIEAWRSHLREETVKIPFSIPEYSKKGQRIKKTEQGWSLSLKKKLQMEIPVSIDWTNPAAAEGSQPIFYLQFKVKNQNPSEDMKIRLNGMQNKLTAEKYIYNNQNKRFSYAVRLEPGTQSVSMEFGAGAYEITDLCCYFGTSCEGWRDLYEAEFFPDKEKTKGNLICGTISYLKDGYLISSIPYEENFEIRIDGEKTEIQKVNTAFLGCELKAGEHTVEIRYHAPGFTAGKWLSLFGLGMAGFLVWSGKIRRLMHKNMR